MLRGRHTLFEDGFRGIVFTIRSLFVHQGKKNPYFYKNWKSLNGVHGI